MIVTSRWAEYANFAQLLANKLPLVPRGLLSGSLANGQLNGSGSMGGQKDSGSLHAARLDQGGDFCEDGPAKKR